MSHISLPENEQEIYLILYYYTIPGSFVVDDWRLDGSSVIPSTA